MKDDISLIPTSKTIAEVACFNLIPSFLFFCGEKEDARPKGLSHPNGLEYI